MRISAEEKIAHLAMIQAVIARMAGNSFALKTLSVTISAGVIALLGAVKEPSAFYILAIVLPVLVFWWMDARYLQLERLYRALFDAVRDEVIVEPFDMRIARFRPEVASILRIALSWSVTSVYAILLVVIAVVAIGIWQVKLW